MIFPALFKKAVFMKEKYMKGKYMKGCAGSALNI